VELLRHTPRIFVLLVAVLAAWLLLFPPDALNQVQSRTLAIVMVTLSLWATGVLAGYLTSLLFFLAAILLDVATPAQVFSGFYSAAFWLVFAGMVIGMAIRSSGLGDRIAAVLGRHLEHSYSWLIGGLLLSCTLLGFIMPSSVGRTVMMVPIGLALAERCGFVSGSKGRTGVALAIAFGCHVPTFAILPSNIPNMVLIGAAETIHGMQFSYTDYFLLHFPLLGVVKALVIGWLILRFFPDRPQLQPAQAGAAPATGLRGDQLKLVCVLLLALLFWLSDSVHGIGPAWVGLGAAIFLLLPRLGLVDGKQFGQQVDMGMLLFLAGVLGVGTLVSVTGLGKLFAGALEHWLPFAPGADFANFMSLSGMSFLASLVTTLPGVPAVMTPMASDLATVTGFSLQTVLMTQVIGFSTILFPYQSGPLLIGMQLAKEPVNLLLKITVPLTLITLLVLVPLDYLWWRLLGMF